MQPNLFLIGAETVNFYCVITLKNAPKTQILSKYIFVYFINLFMQPELCFLKYKKLSF